MSYLEWTLDTEEGIDPYDPLGNLSIVGEQGKLEEKCTYLDVFFEALIQGVKCIEKGQVVKMETFVEPNDIVFDYTGECLVISYAKQKVTIFEKDQFVRDIQESVKNFLQVLDNAAMEAKGEKPKLFILRQFIK